MKIPHNIIAHDSASKQANFLSAELKSNKKIISKTNLRNEAQIFSLTSCYGLTDRTPHSPKTQNLRVTALLHKNCRNKSVKYITKK